MRYKRLKRASPRVPTIIYKENSDKIVDNIIAIDLPQDAEKVSTSYDPENTVAQTTTNPLRCGIGRPSTGCSNYPYSHFKTSTDGYCPNCGKSRVVFDTWKAFDGFSNPCEADGGYTCIDCDADYDIVSGHDSAGSCESKVKILSRKTDVAPVRPCPDGLPCGTSKSTVAARLKSLMAGKSTSNVQSTTGVSGDASSQMKRFRYIQDYLKNSKIKYKYYTGHQRSWDVVIRDKMGNCCDLSRLVVRIAGDNRITNDTVGSVLAWRIGKGQIQTTTGALYNHVWVEFRVDGTWKTFDAVSYLNGGSVTNIFGKLKQTYTYILSGNPCD